MVSVCENTVILQPLVREFLAPLVREIDHALNAEARELEERIAENVNKLLEGE